jgi:hypothetical protein
MSDTIRKQIIANIQTYVASIRKNAAYETEIGQNVYLAKKSQIVVPAIIIWPLSDEVTREYGIDNHVMELRLDGLDSFGSDVPSDVSEAMFGDLIEILTGRKYTLPFTSGGTNRPEVGDLITGATSSATAILESWEIATGAWADGNAAGDFTIRRLDGDFEAENLNIGDHSNLATTNGSKTTIEPVTLATDDLCDDIIFTTGGADQYPEQGSETVGATATFNILFKTQTGNPYQQIT